MSWDDSETTDSSVASARRTGTAGQPLACLVHVSEATSTAQTILLEGDEVTIGRARDCGVPVLAGHISRQHARLRRVADGWVIEDAGSINGIKVNGTRHATLKLTFGDRIDLGRGESLLFRPYDKAYQNAQEEQKLESLGRLAGGIAHDFNNVLAAIIGAASGLRDELRDELAPDQFERYDESLRDVLMAGERGAELVRQLLGFARRREPAASRVRLFDVLEDVARLTSRTFDPSIVVRTSLETDAAVIADQTQLQQVFMNLCLNARDAMPHGGTLAIEVSERSPATVVRQGRFVCVSITDTGIGMPPHVRERMFEPFFSTKGEGKGTGLGLAMAYGIIKGNGGTVEVTSAPGRGTCVQVYLPAVAPVIPETRAAEQVETVPLAPPGKGRMILIAEDEDLVRRHSRRLLERLGFTVLEAKDGVEAVELAQAHAAELALVMLDLQMPRQSGDDACREIMQLDPELPVVMVSGNIGDARIESLVRSLRVAVLGKPFGLEALTEVVLKAR